MVVVTAPAKDSGRPGDAMSSSEAEDDYQEPATPTATEADHGLPLLPQEFPEVVPLNVGGLHFTTRLSTLRRHEDTMLAAMFSGRHYIPTDAEGRYFIDRDGTFFGLQREEEEAYASTQHPPGAQSLTFTKFEEKKTNEKSRKVTTVKKSSASRKVFHCSLAFVPAAREASVKPGSFGKQPGPDNLLRDLKEMFTSPWELASPAEGDAPEAKAPSPSISRQVSLETDRVSKDFLEFLKTYQKPGQEIHKQCRHFLEVMHHKRELSIEEQSECAQDFYQNMADRLQSRWKGVREGDGDPEKDNVSHWAQALLPVAMASLSREVVPPGLCAVRPLDSVHASETPLASALASADGFLKACKRIGGRKFARFQKHDERLQGQAKSSGTKDLSAGHLGNIAACLDRVRSQILEPNSGPMQTETCQAQMKEAAASSGCATKR
ncbi:hypothetical protein JRQ81_008280 [Phrynocephalus forsythii]|uniref:Potassium channel tetramerisation-type BTB domain-containing protein n=1 Tax=Phrynocephalus forsythii TaxID=171643 RepID=A0A9Q1ASR1_9SAUR|nr:hypothetical protein JRQ81_008280 [Phrynocephalus forsythii]